MSKDNRNMSKLHMDPEDFNGNTPDHAKTPV